MKLALASRPERNGGEFQTGRLGQNAPKKSAAHTISSIMTRQ